MSQYDDSRNRHPSRTGRVAPSSDYMEFERLLKDYYEPILDADTYARLRMICGLGPLIEGEIIEEVVKNANPYHTPIEGTQGI